MVGPIGELSAVSERLARGDLNARARPAGPPEVRRVATALNHLARRIRDLLRQEREAAADLSHRLRTPLTALRLDAEALTGSDGADRICADVDALERAVTRVIAEARHAVTDAEVQAAGGPAHCDAAAVVRERVDFWSVLADDTERDVTTDLAPSPLPVGLSANDLSAAVDALLGNVFAHTCDGTRFAVTLTAVPGGGARLVIRDYGPGFPGPSPHQLLQRGASGAASSGLGLDISCRAARASGGDLTVESPPEDGAQVTCVLGPAKAGER
jgi:signal transduction histidine kinase